MEKRRETLGGHATALLNLAEAIRKVVGEIKVPFMPQTLVTGGDSGSVQSGVGAALKPQPKLPFTTRYHSAVSRHRDRAEAPLLYSVCWPSMT